MRTRAKGKAGERRAEGFLRRRGFEVLARNYRRLSGEIDLIAKKDGVIYFVEVKTRNEDFPALERIDDAKVERMRLTAEAYLAERGWEEREVRFILLIVGKGGVKAVPLNESLL